jgi:lysylphosphatidylglycerol synthase-like protein
MIPLVRRTLLTLFALAVGAALLVWQVQLVGADRISSGLRAIGWGFLAILVLSFLRFVARSTAWTVLIGQRVPLMRAVAATISGDALGNVTPLSLLVSEPTKAMYLDSGTGSSRSLAALTAENFFYSVSVGIYVMLGTAAMLRTFPLPGEIHVAGIAALVLMAGVLVAAAWTAWQKPALASTVLSGLPFRRLTAIVDRVRDFELQTYGSAGTQGGRLVVVFVCEATFHLLSFLEAWLTIWLVTGLSAPLFALVLDTFNRVVNIVAKMIPFRIGVDQVTSESVAVAIGLGPAIGTTVSLIRTGRMAVWAAVGLALLTRKGLVKAQGPGPKAQVRM